MNLRSPIEEVRYQHPKLCDGRLIGWKSAVYHICSLVGQGGPGRVGWVWLRRGGSRSIAGRRCCRVCVRSTVLCYAMLCCFVPCYASNIGTEQETLKGCRRAKGDIASRWRASITIRPCARTINCLLPTRILRAPVTGRRGR